MRNRPGRNRNVIAIIMGIFVNLVLIVILALQNSPINKTWPIRSPQKAISSIILSKINLVEIPEDQKLHSVGRRCFTKFLALQTGKFQFITASQISTGAFKNTAGSMNNFTIAVIEPYDLQDKNPATRRRIIKRVDELAIQGKIDAIVEASASDVIRDSTWGIKQVQRLRQAGVIRCVIFDGGHHVRSLALNPDILLIPTIYFKNNLYASHWFTRDSVPLKDLKKVLRDEGIDSIVALFPRIGIPIKNPNGMAWIAAQAINEINNKIESKGSLPNYGQLPLVKTDFKNHAPKREAIFISLEVDEKASELDILSKLRFEVKRKEAQDGKVRQVYVGITSGNSMFPFKSKMLEYNGNDLEVFLNKNLPYKVMVLTEPISTWNIILYRLGIQ
ncbi:MAG: hypothetical protein QME63_09485 [Actinomycetota bacterium]|nr:hypothetical protein [Actinomycetota bacterium]